MTLSVGVILQVCSWHGWLLLTACRLIMGRGGERLGRNKIDCVSSFSLVSGGGRGNMYI